MSEATHTTELVNGARPPATSDETARAEALRRDSLIWDMTLPGMFSGLNDGATLDRYRAAGYGFVSVTVGNDSTWNASEILRRLATFRTTLKRQPEKFVVVGTASDIERARAQGTLAVSFHLQGTNALEGDLSWVEAFFRLGVTHMLLAYNNKNAVGDGCAERTDAGLSRYGVSLIEEMNRVGMIVDGSHSGYRTTMEAIEVSTRPFIFSHANAAGVFQHYRNIRDDQIEACAASGGVVGITGVGAYLSEDGEASPENVFRHIDHVASLVGARHVGLGFDFITEIDTFAARVGDTADQWPSNNGKPVRFDQFAAPEIVGPVIETMCRQGYSDDDVRQVLGGNFLRVFKAVVG
ncbi:MAG: dipeptidase [Hyphomicrobiales bacterium]|nr:dipeptidase [Hyphomicrobiales bacterium]